MLAFDHEGRPIKFDTWLDDLQLLLLSDSRDSVSLFDRTSGAAPAPPATADSATRSLWLTLARYSSLAAAALGRLLLPYLFPELSAFATVEDLVSHLRTSDARYRAALPTEFLAKNPPPMYITLYFIVTRLPDSLRAVRDHFLALYPTDLTVDLKQHLLAAETSIVAVGAARGTPRTPFFESFSPSPLAPSYASAAAVDVLGAEEVGAASTSGKRRNSKGKGGRGGRGGSGGGGGGSSGGCGAGGGGGSGGSGGGSGGFGSGGGGSGGSGGSGSGGSGGGRTGAQCGGSGGGQRQRQQRRSETLSPQQLREWLFQRGASRGSVSYPYVIHTGDRAGQKRGKAHTQHCCFSRLDNAWRAEFGDEVERPCWVELLRSGVAIFDLDYDAILSAMYASSASAEGDCYRCVPPDPGIESAALGACESSLPSTAPAEALHTFTLDSGASCWFFRDNTSLTPLPAPYPVRLANPSGPLDVARSSNVLPCPPVPSCSLSGLHLPLFSTNLVSTPALQDAMVTTNTPGGQRVSICTCTRTGRHLATFTRQPGSSLYTLATEPPQVAASTQHHRLGHPSLPRLRGMHSRLIVSGLPRSLPPPPPSPALPCLPCVEGRQRAAPQSSSFPPTTAFLQTLHMDVWGPARFSGQGRERYFLLVVDDYTRNTTVFPLRSKGQVVDVLIPWIRTVRLQLCERFRADLPVCIYTLTEVDFTFDESVPFYRLFPYRSAPPPPPSLFLALGPPPVDPLPPQGPAPSGVSQVDPLSGTAPVEVAVGSGAARGAASGGAASGVADFEGAGSGGAEPRGEELGGVEPASVEPGGAEPEGVEPGGAELEGAECGIAEPWGAASSRGPAGASPRLSPQQLREWLVRQTRLWSGAIGAGGAGAAGARGAGVPNGAGGTGGPVAAGAGGARTKVTGAAGTGGSGAGGAEAGGAGAGGIGARGAGAGGAGVGGTGAGGWSCDPSLFLRTDTSLPPFYVLVYVDDLVFATADTEALTLVKSKLQKRHTCTDLGEMRSYLGLQITRDRARRTITLTQSHMVHQVLQRYDFQFSLP
ncbi:unnamed protein product [Closterium sp. NIES-54]